VNSQRSWLVLLLPSSFSPRSSTRTFSYRPHRSVFYLSIFGSILALANGIIPEENRMFDSEVLMKAIVQYTPHLPDEWREYLHSKTVHTQFGGLFVMKAVTFATELPVPVKTIHSLVFPTSVRAGNR